jgi:hypothetical protein
LRESLTGGNLASRLYSDWLTRFLDEVDRFFGDAGTVDRTLVAHAFGLKAPVPLWTASAFDRCLSLALIYPIAAIFIIWVVSGYVGPAEIPLGLQAYTEAWRQEVAAGLIGFSVPLFRRSLMFIMWQAAIAASLVAGVLAGVVAVAFAVAFSRAIAGAGAIAIAVPSLSLSLSLTPALLPSRSSSLVHSWSPAQSRYRMTSPSKVTGKAFFLSCFFSQHSSYASERQLYYRILRPGY